jgi:hypothetical protein
VQPNRPPGAMLHFPGPLLVRFTLWCLCFLVAPLPLALSVLTFQAEVLCATTVGAPHIAESATVDPQELTARILSRLEQSETRETDPWLQGDYRQAWISVSTFSRGKFPTFSDAFVAASYLMYGVHPDQVWPRIVARRRAMLGASYGDFFPQDLPGVESPKKPCTSVRLRDGKRIA